MDITEFRNSLLDQIKVAATVDLSTDKEAFLNYASDALTEADQLDDGFTLLPFEGIGTKQRKIQIDGYVYNELDNCLLIFIAPPLTYQSEETLANTEAERIFGRARAFIEEANYITENAEESAPGYGLAVDIQKRYANVRKYQIYLLTDMAMSKNIREIKSTIINGKPVEYHIWDIRRFFQLHESKTGKEDIVINLKEFTEHGIPCLPASKTEDYTAYLCNIPGMLLAILYNTYGGKLLEGNVRSFLQTKCKVNKGIRNTILNEPDMFFAYNNGIAATAYDLKIETINDLLYITEITALQIVNGGQTTASLATALLNDKRDGAEENIRRIFVPMKLSIVSPEKSQVLIPNISRYANSQNKVSEADLWSNHPFHIRIEDFSRRVLAPATDGKQYGTYWYYERANGQYRQETYKATEAERKRFEMQNPKAQMFNKTDLAKYINIYQMLPHIASAGGQHSFAKFADWASVQWEKSDTVFNEAFFRRLIAIAILFRQSDKLVKQQPWYNSYKANIVAYTISKIIYTVKKDYPDKTIDFKNLWQKQALSAAWVKQIELSSKLMYDFLISDSRPVENVTEWAKREQCWEQAKAIETQLEPEFVNELIYREKEQEQQKDARAEQKLTNKVNAMVEVAGFGVDNWKLLAKWGLDHGVLTPVDMSFLRTAISMEKGSFPSEKQCGKILDVLDKARLEGFSK